MTKLLSLVAVLGLLAAPAFANEEKAAAPAAEIAKIDCKAANLSEKDKAECAKEAKKEGTKEAAPAAGETKKEEKKN